VKVIGYASVVLVGVWAMSRVKTLRVHDTLHAAILPFFVFTNPQVQYFNIRYLLFLHHLGGDRFRFRDGLGIVILLSTEVVANYSHWFGNGRYAQTSLTSVGIALYFASQIPFMFGDIVRGLRPEGRSALLERFLDRLAVVGPALGLALSFTVFSAYWSRGTPIGHERVRTRADVSRKRETGSDVRQEGVLRVKRPTWIEVGRKPANQPFVEVAFAPKNRFVLEFRRGSKVLGKVKVSAKKSQRKKKGMHVRTFKVPDAAVEQGYTYVRVVPSKPVRLGHLRLLEHDSDE
jgi:hypothetical protein